MKLDQLDRAVRQPDPSRTRSDSRRHSQRCWTEFRGPLNLYDAHGSVSALTDDPGGVVQTSYSYDPYGETTKTGSVANPFQFASGYHDEVTGLYKFGARYYQPENARWTQQDPVGGGLRRPKTLNRYAYANCDPVNFSDPSGLAIPAPPHWGDGDDGGGGGGDGGGGGGGGVVGAPIYPPNRYGEGDTGPTTGHAVGQAFMCGSAGAGVVVAGTGGAGGLALIGSGILETATGAGAVVGLPSIAAGGVVLYGSYRVGSQAVSIAQDNCF